MNDFGVDLNRFYRTWSDKIRIVIDKTKPFQERLEALHWIDVTALGEEKTPGDDLEKVADELRAEGLGED